MLQSVFRPIILPKGDMVSILTEIIISEWPSIKHSSVKSVTQHNSLRVDGHFTNLNESNNDERITERTYYVHIHTHKVTRLHNSATALFHIVK
jgi:hypothetical protein